MAGRAPPKKKPALDPLLKAVLDDPADDAKRLVCADALSERGDPRGEFIVAQMHGGDAVANEEWLGPIAKIVDPTRTVFRRGFVAQVVVKKGPRPAIEKTAGAIEWGTIERVEFAQEVGGVAIKHGTVKQGLDTPAARVLLHPAMRALREVSGIDADVLATLATRGTARPLEAIEAFLAYRALHSVDALPAERTVSGRTGGRASQIFAVDDGMRAALSERSLFPKLKRLTLQSYPSLVPDALWLVRTALAARLDCLSLENWGGSVSQWAGIAQGAAKGLIQLSAHPDSGTFLAIGRFEHERWHYDFTRGADGLLSALHASIRTESRPSEHDSVTRFIAELADLEPGVLESLKVTVSRGLHESEQKTISAHAARAGIAMVE